MFARLPAPRTVPYLHLGYLPDWNCRTIITAITPESSFAPQTKTPAEAGVSRTRREVASTQADFFFGAAFFAAGLVTVGLAPTTAGAATCARELP